MEIQEMRITLTVPQVSLLPPPSLLSSSSSQRERKNQGLCPHAHARATTDTFLGKTFPTAIIFLSFFENVFLSFKKDFFLKENHLEMIYTEMTFT